MQEPLTTWACSQLGPGLRSPLLEVRQRALRSLQFKLQNGLLAPKALARDTALLSSLLSCFEGSAEDEASQAVVLEVLCVLAQDPVVAASLLALGADQAMISPQNNLPSPLAGLADQLLGAMYSAHRGQGGGSSNAATESLALLPSYTVPEPARGRLFQGAPSPPLALPYQCSSTCYTPTTVWGGSSGKGGLHTASMPATHFNSPDSKGRAQQSSCSQDSKASSARREFLERQGLHARAAQLSPADAQQLEELCGQLAHSENEAGTLMALLQLRAGALADVPAEGILVGTDIIPALLGLVATGGGAASSALPAAALECLHPIVQGLAAAVVHAGSGLDTTPLGPLAHQLLRTCAAALRDFRLHSIGVPLLLAVLPLTRPAGTLEPQGAEAGAFTCSWRAALASLADALHLSMVAACTVAGVVPPSDWEGGRLSIVVDARVKLLAQLAACFLENIPAEHLAEAMPDALRPLLGGLFSSPLASSLLPRLQAAVDPHVGMMAPQTLQHLEAAACLSSKKAQLLSAVAQLAKLSSPGQEVGGAVLECCCREVLGSLAAMNLLGRQEIEGAVGSIMRSCAVSFNLPAAPPELAGHVAAAILAHPLPAARHAATCTLAEEADSGMLSLVLILHPLVLGALVTVGLADEQMQPHVLHTLQRAAVVDGRAASAALLKWQPWLVCYKDCPAPVGPAISSLLQVAQLAPGAGLWLQLQPQLMGLFSSDPALLSEVASQLFSRLVGRGDPLSAAMQYSLQPFAGLLVPAEQSGTPPPPRRSSVVAAHLFSSEDVQGLLHAASSRSVPTDVVAQALMQLAHVACDSRFHAVLGSAQVLKMLVDHIRAGSDLLQPALDCLVQVLENMSASASCLLEDADRQAMHLAQLAFHPIPAVRYKAAQALQYLLVAPSTAQWLDLQRQLSIEPVSALQPGILECTVVAEPFARMHLFPQAPAAVIPVTPGKLRSSAGGEDNCPSEEVQRLWEAQQIVQAAATTGDGLAALLSEETATVQPWRHSFVRASRATLEYLDVDCQLGQALQRLQQSKSHQECHAMLAAIKLLCCVEQGVDILARQGWNALEFLIGRAPLSLDDIQLWAALLPLLRQAISSPSISPDNLLLIVTKLVGRSGLQWLAGVAASDPVDPDARTATCHLMQEVMELCSTVLEKGMVSALDPQQAVGAIQLESWVVQLLDKLCSEAAPYSTKLAAARLLVTITKFLQYIAARGRGCGRVEAWLPESSTQAVLLASISPIVRHILMAKDCWHPEHLHGKTLVMHLLQHLLVTTQMLPAGEWAMAWAAVGGTYWLSRLAKDHQAYVKELAFGLLAALALPKPTRAMLAVGWPECGSIACRVAADAGECTAVRAAAMRVGVAAMSHAEAELGLNAEEAAQGVGKQLCTLSTEFLREQRPLWTAAIEAAQDEGSSPGLLAGAAHALLQLMLADTDMAWQVLSVEGRCQTVAANLLSTPLRLVKQCSTAADSGDATTGLGGNSVQGWPATAAGWEQLRDSLEAAATGAELLVALLQLLPESAPPTLCHDAVLRLALSCCALAAALSTNCLHIGVPAAAHAAQAAAWPALEALAHAAALLLAAKDAWGAGIIRSGAADGPMPLAVALANTLQMADGNRAVVDACCRLMQALLHREDWARAFLHDRAGWEYAVQGKPHGSTVGTWLCMQLVERFLPQQESSQQAGCDPAIPAALRSLLAYSDPAKAVAVQMGLHSSLLEACRSLAGALAAAGAQKALSSSNSDSRAGKLQSLKKQRAAAVAAAAAPKQARDAGSGHGKHGAGKEPAKPRDADSDAAGLEEQAGCHDADCVAAAQLLESQSGKEKPGQAREAAAAAAAGGQSGSKEQGQDQSQRSMQRLLLFLDLLRQLAFKSQLASDALCTSGLASLSADTLWRLGSSASPVMLAVLGLLANAAASSKDMRVSWVVASGTRGGGGLLALLMAAVLRTSMPLPLHRQAGATLSTFLATVDGCSAALRAEMLPQAMRSVQDFMAAKDWARLEVLLQVLASLASQPEAQKALPRTTAPSGSLLDILLGLVQHHIPAVAVQAVLVLRNVALLPENKAHFLSQAGALQSLVDAMAQAAEQPAKGAYAASALWALISAAGGEKVKAALRGSTGLAGAISAAANSCSKALEMENSSMLGNQCEQLITACENLALRMS